MNQGICQDVSEVFSENDSLYDGDDTPDMSTSAILDVSNIHDSGAANSPPKMTRSATALLGELGVQEELLLGFIIAGDLH